MDNVLAERAPLRLRRPARLLRLASDDRLVALVRAGEEGAFEALYDRHHPAILGFCRHMLGTREEAEDAVQHTFLSAFRDLVATDKPIELRPWLFAIARNRCVSLLRTRRAHVAIELAEPATDGLAATVERREDLRELLGDLGCLPEEQRAALLLAELGALDHAGIAMVLGCPREKVKALVFQARTSLLASREARATPCEEIRMELATASGGALRRGPLRRHLRTCDGCRAFKAQVATQRQLLVLALPVLPSVALKASVLSGAGAAPASGGAAAAAAMTAGASSGASAGTLGGVLGTVASTGAGKAAVAIAVAGAIASGGALTERHEHRSTAPSGPASTVASDVAHQPFFAAGAPGTHGAAKRTPAGDPASLPPTHRRRPQPGHRSDASGTTPTAAVQFPAPPHLAPRGSAHTHSTQAPPHPLAPVPEQPAAPVSDGEATPPGHGGTPPGQGGTPPGQGGTPPGQGGTPPGQGGTLPGQGQSAAPHLTPPGHGGTPPGQGKQSGTPPGQSGTPPGQSGTPPGQSGTPPGKSRAPHGHGH